METRAQALPQTGSQRPAIAALVVDLIVTMLLQPALVYTAVIWGLRPWTLVIPLAVAVVPLTVALWAHRSSRRTATWVALAWAVLLALAGAAYTVVMYLDVFSW
jgi:hypothetical protein